MDPRDVFALLACTHQSTHRMRVNVAVHCNHMFSCSFLPRMAFHHFCSTCAVECAHKMQVQIVMTHRIWIPEMLALLACTHHLPCWLVHITAHIQCGWMWQSIVITCHHVLFELRRYVFPRKCVAVWIYNIDLVHTSPHIVSPSEIQRSGEAMREHTKVFFLHKLTSSRTKHNISHWHSPKRSWL